MPCPPGQSGTDQDPLRGAKEAQTHLPARGAQQCARGTTLSHKTFRQVINTLDWTCQALGPGFSAHGGALVVRRSFFLISFNHLHLNTPHALKLLRHLPGNLQCSRRLPGAFHSELREKFSNFTMRFSLLEMRVFDRCPQHGSDTPPPQDRTSQFHKSFQGNSGFFLRRGA